MTERRGSDEPRVTFSQVHILPHLKKIRAEPSEVEAAIWRQIEAEIRGASLTGHFEYRAFTLPEGIIYVGTYYLTDELMVTTSTFHRPSTTERRIFTRLLEDPFPGRDALSDQLSSCEVRTIDEGGSLEIRVRSHLAAKFEKTVPVEAEAEDQDGITVHYLLHVANGRPVELQIYKDDGSPIRRMPHIDDLRVVHLPA